MTRFSKMAQGMRSSEIRRLMALAADPNIISLAGGSPGNDLFPIKELDDIYASLSLAAKQTACQYGPTSGYPPLLESLKAYLATKGLPVETNKLLITTGAQQAINLVSKILLDPGDRVIAEYPSFIGAIAAFLSYGARLHGVAMDAEGIVIDKLAAALDRYKGPRLKLLYLNPNFQNPGGTMYTLGRKRQVLDLLAGRELCLLEDDPYAEIYFDEADRPNLVPMKAMGQEPVPICYVGSFAKIFGPGMRLGWLLAPPDVYEKAELAKQSLDACSASFTQVLAHEFLKQGKLPGYVAMVRHAYSRKAKIMLDTLAEHMPRGVTWTRPRGGFFVWVTMPRRVNASDVFNKAIEKGTAFVIGSAFDPAGKKNNTMRLAFSFTPEEKVAVGTRMVCEAVKACL
jgi:DNA-binding transcriptional MocR family regulator